MNKTKILLFLILALKINASLAQGGIDLSVSPYNGFRSIRGETDNAFVGGQYTSFKIGYFKWMNESAMLKLSLEVNSIKNENHKIYNTGSFPTKTEIVNFNYEATSYIFRYEAIGVHNEIDYKSHFFFKSAYLLGIKNAKFDVKFDENIAKGSDLGNFSPNQESLDGMSVLFGIEYGLGYQYNITKLIGVYADADAGYILPNYIYFNTNVGVRYRLN